MEEFSLHVEIDTPPAGVWAVLRDFGNIADWNRNVVKSHLVGDVKEGPGTERFCDFGMGMNVREQVTVWKENEELEVDFTKFMMPYRSATSRFVLEPTAAGTRVDFNMAFEPKGFGKLLAFAMRKQMRKDLTNLLADLKTRSEQAAPQPEAAA